MEFVQFVWVGDGVLEEVFVTKIGAATGEEMGLLANTGAGVGTSRNVGTGVTLEKSKNCPDPLG